MDFANICKVDFYQKKSQNFAFQLISLQKSYLVVFLTTYKLVDFANIYKVDFEQTKSQSFAFQLNSLFGST